MDHLLCVAFYDDPKEPLLVIETQLNTHAGFFRRLKTSIRYLFSPRSFKSSAWEETVITPRDASVVKSILQEYLGSCVRASYQKPVAGEGDSNEDPQGGAVDCSSSEIPEPQTDV